MTVYYYEKAEIVQEIDLNQDNVIEASAGTGKTFTIEHIVIELLLGDHAHQLALNRPLNIRDILLVTFTEKATLELKKKIRWRIQEVLESRLEHPQTDPAKHYWCIGEKERAILANALLEFEAIAIYTIHGFCNRILQEFAFENRQLFEQEQIENFVIFPEVFRKALRKHLIFTVPTLLQMYLEENSIESLERELLEIIPQKGRLVPKVPETAPLLETLFPLVLALKRCLTEGDPEIQGNVIWEAYNQMNLNMQQCKTTLPNLKALLHILAQSRETNRPLELLIDILSINLSKVFQLKFKKSKSKDKPILSENEIPPETLEFINQGKKLEAILNTVSSELPLGLLDYCLHHRDDKKSLYLIKKISDYLKWVKVLLFHKAVPMLREALNQFKAENGYFDFDDMLLLVEKGLKKLAAVEEPLLMKAVRQKYRYALIDEFQDTDQTQWNIFKTLFLESSKHRLIVIGDPKQAIYAFRGGDIVTYLMAVEKIQEITQTPPLSLLKNFRSSPQVIDGLNTLFSHESLFNEDIRFQPVSCGIPTSNHKDTTDQNAIHLFKIQPVFQITSEFCAKELKQGKLGESLITNLKKLRGRIFSNPKLLNHALQGVIDPEEALQHAGYIQSKTAFLNADIIRQTFAETIAKEIHELLFSNPPKFEIYDPVLDTYRRVQKNEICVLFRSKNEGVVLANHLREHRVPFAFYKQSGLFQTREAYEIYDILSAIHDPTHSKRSKTLLTRFFNIPLEDLEAFQNDERSHRYFQLLNRWHKMANQRQFKQMFNSILEESQLYRHQLFINGGERETTNYEHIFEILAREVFEKHLDLQELLFWFNGLILGKIAAGKEGDVLHLESDENAVQLMTMHASKGLEFPIVFVYGGFSRSPNLSRYYIYHEDKHRLIDLIKSNKAIFENEQKAEDQRLLYVALTRTKQKLYLPYIPFKDDDPASKKRVYNINGTYGEILPSLDAIYQSISTAGVADGEDNMQLFSMDTIEHTFLKSKIHESASSLSLDDVLEQWKPDFPTKFERHLNYGQLKLDRKAFTISSYTKMTHQAEALAQEPIRTFLDPENPVASTPETDEANTVPLLTNDQIPPGTKTGIFLHALLEKIDFTSLSQASSQDAWKALPNIQHFILELLDHYDFSREYFDHCASILWETLTQEYAIGEGHPQLPPFYQLTSYLREMDFYFPIPENFHPSLINGGATTDDLYQWREDRGFLTGSIDFVFEHHDKVYFVDWKSNSLPAYTFGHIEQVVNDHYFIQIIIYSLALVKWYKIQDEETFEKKFGGLFYIFLRGVPHQQGIYFKKPTWQEMIDFEKRLNSWSY